MDWGFDLEFDGWPIGFIQAGSGPIAKSLGQQQ
jgi:hypothetical protein